MTKYTLQEAKEYAISKFGKCLSDKYSLNLLWECKDGHRWNKSFTKTNMSWCAACAGNKKLTIQHACDLAAKKNGKCLSIIYINTQTNLDWQCEFKHEWPATYSNIRKNKWCPYCSGGSGEELCRSALEQMFNLKFNKIRPDWLRDPINNYKLELDGYCEELNIAFEHNGMQHYQLTEFTKTINDLENIQRKDKLKLKLCEKQYVKLMVIPQVPDVISVENLKDFILEQCLILNILTDNINKNIILNTKVKPRVIKLLEKFQEIAKNRGGECLSVKYINDNTKLKFICKNDHRWDAFPGNISKGHWCRYCREPRNIIK